MFDAHLHGAGSWGNVLSIDEANDERRFCQNLKFGHRPDLALLPSFDAPSLPLHFIARVVIMEEHCIGKVLSHSCNCSLICKGSCAEN